jgi:hypothetical protein
MPDQAKHENTAAKVPMRSHTCGTVMTGVAVAALEIVNPEEASIQVEKDELPLLRQIEPSVAAVHCAIVYCTDVSAFFDAMRMEWRLRWIGEQARLSRWPRWRSSIQSAVTSRPNA